MTTSHADAVRRARYLMALAQSTTSESERDAATMKAIELRLKYGVSDADLAAVGDDEDDGFEIFGMRIFYYSRTIKPHLERIETQIAEVLEKIRTMDPRNQVDLLSRFYADLKEVVDGNSYKNGFLHRRNQAIRDYYQQLMANAKATDPTVERHTAHDSALFSLKMALPYSLRRKDTLERIVGATHEKLWEQDCRDHRCYACGLDGNEGRAMVGLFEREGKWEYSHAECHSPASA